MREILFKGKRKDWRELPKEEWWVEGMPMYFDDRSFIVTNLGINCIEDTEPDKFIQLHAFEVIPETVCQYTGLTDKSGKNSKNGKKIFEGDIVIYLEEIENICYNNLFYREKTGLFEPRRERHNEKFTGTISFDKDFCGYIVKPVKATCRITYARKSLRDFFIKNIKVIGNIYDNPELLEVQE